MIVYTLIGSLLMLVAAIATAIIAADGGQISFSIAELAQQPLGEGSQRWIFWFFAAAFLVKMPAFLLHGWMPDAYRAAPLPALAVFSGVLAKVGAYGFLRVVLPLFPDATVEFQEVILVIALASILYGSVMAFTQTNVRLIAGYSSVAQLGFITAGIFALSADGADGAVLQMVNHGLVVAPLFVIVAILAERSGSEDLREMGGMAMRAPVLAALFLIVTLATLAMPGSANFIGEFYILNGLFDSKIVFAFVAITGVAMSAYYALRLYQRTMHNRKPEGIESREIGWRDGVVLVPLVVCILGLALYPQLILKPHRRTCGARSAVAAAFEEPGRQCTSGPERPAMNFNAPEIDYAALSPVLALTAGLCVVLLTAVFKPLRRTAPGLTLTVLATTAGLLIWQWGDPPDARRRRPAPRRPGDLDLADRDPHRRLRRAALDPRAGRRAGRLGRVPRAAARLGAGHGAAGPGAEPGQLLRRDRDALDPALHPLRHQHAPRAVARVGAQVPDRRLARLGDAALRDGLALRRLGLDRLRRDRRGDLRSGPARRPAGPDRDRAAAPSGSPSRPRSPPSTSGRPTSTRARRPRSPASWRWRPRRLPSPSSSASSTSP